MRPLSELIDERLVSELRQRAARDQLGDVDFETAMKFLLTDGVLPASGLPVADFLAIEDWVRSAVDAAGLCMTATELKNRTGRVIEAVLRGQTVTILRHGRPIAVVRPLRDVSYPAATGGAFGPPGMR